MSGMKPIDLLSNNTSSILKFDKDDKKSFEFSKIKSTLASNKIFPIRNIDWYDRFSRYGYIDPYSTEQVVREYLFFTKPDLHIFEPGSYNTNLNKDLANIPFFSDNLRRNGNALKQLQYSVKDSNGAYNPFMYLLSNAVTSKLDLPGISADSKDSTPNIMGTTLKYRTQSYKSDTDYDFTLSFTDTAYLEVYTLLKAYDEYTRLLKTGEVAPIKKYITSKISSEQFSIYKFLIGEDGETILFYAKLTGCYFTDVPRGDFGDPGNDGFKFSASLHAQFVEDNNPMILTEFNRISPYGNRQPTADRGYRPVYDYRINAVNNDWVRYPKIITVNNNDKRVSRRGTHHDYRIKWF